MPSRLRTVPLRVGVDLTLVPVLSHDTLTGAAPFYFPLHRVPTQGWSCHPLSTTQCLCLCVCLNACSSLSGDGVATAKCKLSCITRLCFCVLNNRSTWFWMMDVHWGWWSGAEQSTLLVFTLLAWTRGQRPNVEDLRYYIDNTVSVSHTHTQTPVRACVVPSVAILSVSGW